MQSVTAAFTAEERDVVRKIVQSFAVSWKKQIIISNRTFTIGVSTIGGGDVIGINPGAIGSPGNYKYFDESAYVMSLGWERGYNMPVGGLSKSLAEAQLDNTSKRFTPRFMGGNSELFTAILPRRPVIIGAGFNFAGIDQTIPQFAGQIDRQPHVDVRTGIIKLQMADYMTYFQNKFLDQELMFTGQRTDQVLATILGTAGMSTAQYDLDYGINNIPFGIFNKGTRLSQIIHELVEAENGHFYQDESGIFKFENRQHWDSSPYTNIQRIITTAQVITQGIPSEDHLINVVEISANIRQKQAAQTIFNLAASNYLTIPAGGNLEQFFEFTDPVLQITDPTPTGTVSFFVANAATDESSTDLTSSISVTNIGTFAKAVKYRIRNNSSEVAYVTQFVLSGRIAKQVANLYYRQQDDSSVTAYEEKVLTLNNDYIQDPIWAQSLSTMLLNDFSDIEKLQTLTIRAIPELQLGDLISWQGRYWRIFDIKSILDPGSGYIQELTMLQRTIASYFRIGISTIGGGDRIAP